MKAAPECASGGDAFSPPRLMLQFRPACAAPAYARSRTETQNRKANPEKPAMNVRPIARAFAALVLLAAPLAQASETVFPVGSHIGLTPPAGMTASQSFPGFEDRDRKAAILINQLPGPAYEHFLKSMSAGAINIPGVSNAKREIMLTEGGAAHLVTGDQEADGVKFRKWLLITRRTVASHDTDQTFSFVVTAQVPIEASDAYPDSAIRKVLGTVALRASVPPQEILGQLPFRVEELAKFEHVSAIVPGRAVLLSERHPAPQSAGQGTNMLLSIEGGAPAQAGDRGSFSESILSNIQGFRNLKVVFSEPLRVGGQPGYEIRLEGQSAHDNTDVVIVQWTRFSGGTFIRVVGVSPKEKWSENFTRFRAVRDGIDTR